jgi:Sec-independent protein translocase protein TatA
MDFLGVGVPELIFVMLIALIFMGPRDLEKAGRTIGSGLRKLLTSDAWRAIRETGKVVSNLPNQLAREAQFDEAGRPVEKEPGPAASGAFDPRENYGIWSDAPKDWSPGRGKDAIRVLPPEPPQPPDGESRNG